MRSNNIVSRVVLALAVGLAVGVVAFILLAFISAIVPGFSIDSLMWAGLLGLAGAVIYLVTGKSVL